MVENLNLTTYLSTLQQKGYLAYEYNPFHNYQTDVDLYEIDTNIGKVLVPEGQAVNKDNGELLINKNGKWVDKRGNIINNCKTTEGQELYAKAGSLIDFDTEKLNFDLEHPVDIEIQPSYDGSVNLILNDDKNIPRLINSRFSAREKGTYEIVDRVGENDTNIYNAKTFDKDTSLYFQYEYNPIIKYMGFVRGTLPVGQYCFYFTYCDTDDNESDYIAETGVIPVFIGSDRDPFSIDGGIKNQITDKGIKLKINNLDKSYNYLKVYYVRYFADYQQNRVYEAKKIYKKYPINSDILYLQITGYEDAEDIDANILNITRFNPKSILAQAQCKNMLFFGNIVKNADNYRELTDIALRIYPEIECINNFSSVTNEYDSTNNTMGYYDSQNMQSSVGYFNHEYYRFGVVFIYQNGTLSNVYNTLGCELTENSSITYYPHIFSDDGIFLKRNYIKVSDEGWIMDTVTGRSFLNARGVCKLNYPLEEDYNTIYGIKFNISKEVSDFLKNDLGIRGFFIVRQKRIPNAIAQCYLLPIDDQLEAPVLEVKNGDTKSEYFTETFVESKIKEGSFDKNGTRLVTNSYEERLYKYKYVNSSENAISQNAYAAICPDFLLNQPFYNQIFNGSKFRIQKLTSNNYLVKNSRFYNSQNTNTQYNNSLSQVIISSVTEDVPTVALKDKVYRLEIGETEESFRFQYAEIDKGTYDAGEDDFDSINESTNIVRGKFSPYLAIYSNTKLDTSELYNIYRDSSANEKQEYQNRMSSSEPFYAISDRYNFEGIINNQLVCWRGDCYINTFTYRLNRNFNDPSLPNNDKIIDKYTWKDNYKVENQENWTNISRSDINAVQLGSWITFKLRSSINYALRSQDHSYVSEEALMGSPRSFYPRSLMMWRGENKMPDSYLYNDAYRATLGFKCYFAFNDINYIKDTFSNRIQYSAISVQDSYKNNYRYSLSTYFRDYSQEYGSIQKLLGFEGYLLVVFEHAIGIAVINERILAGSGDGEPVFINTNNVLPEELTIITDTYGTQWPESVIKSESGIVYGVDTISKKIWRVSGQNIEILSDFKVGKFLIDNISLGERETSPIIGLRNVKTHYNNNKKDIMFTFYDDIYKDEEKVWNLCYNELLGEFVTFYSWIPSYSENIDTQFFSFNRNTSKWLTLLNKCNYRIPNNTGVLLDIPIVPRGGIISIPIHYINENTEYQTVLNADGTVYNKPTNTQNLKLKLLSEITENIKFKIEKDHWKNYTYAKFKIDSGQCKIILFEGWEAKLTKENPIFLLEITPYVENQETLIYFATETVAITTKDIVENQALTESDKANPNLTTDFYLHGQSGIFDVAENLYPTYWYGEFHPFEFEFVVNDNIAQQKIFTNLVLISNKVEPESFHFEIEGDNYDFSKDKRTMYFRQEATKNLYQNLGSNILYDRYFTDVAADKYTYEQYYRGDGYSPNYGEGSKENKYSEYKTRNKFNWDKAYPVENKGLVKQVKSTIFPLYYEKIDTYNDIYYKYQMMHDDTGEYDFQNLSGSEIGWNRTLNQFNIITHIKNNPVDIVGRLRGNSRYNEGKWNIQIPSISFMQKNEDNWVDPNGSNILDYNSPLNIQKFNKIPPIVINSQNVPEDLTDKVISVDKLPNIYTRTDRTKNTPITEYISVGDWTYRQETKIRDKWMKIRVRYSGRNLAVIHSLLTLYNISYS